LRSGPRKPRSCPQIYLASLSATSLASLSHTRCSGAVNVSQHMRSYLKFRRRFVRFQCRSPELSVRKIFANRASYPDGVNREIETVEIATLCRERELQVVKRKNLWRSVEFREKTVERMKSGETTRALAKELGVHRSLLYRWRNRLAAVEPTANDAKLLPLPVPSRPETGEPVLRPCPAETNVDGEPFWL
jgi:transposase-like protein